MEFRIADTFTASLARLTGDEQKAVKTTAFDLQIRPSQPGLNFHKLDRAKDKRFWSVRVSRDIRLIVHRTDESLLLCYVDHHDKAYAWAERRRLETHPKTGAAQLVEIRETVKEIVVPVYVPTEEVAPPSPPKCLVPALAGVADDVLLSYGVPAEWLPDIKAATEDTLLFLTEHLPAEAAEAVLELATGGTPRARVPVAAVTSPFEHPDAQRRFLRLTSAEELQQALDFPWDKWTVFLHPEQRQWVERDFEGPARISGSAGTGKTVVALHRAARLARSHPEARVLLTTFSDTLAAALHTGLKRLLGAEPRLAERIDVYALGTVGRRLYGTLGGGRKIAERDRVRGLVADATAAIEGHGFSLQFVIAEWEQVVDAWQLATWDAYRDVPRLGRRTRLTEPRREVLWSILERVRNALEDAQEVTEAGMFAEAIRSIANSKRVVYDFTIVDEAQDISIGELRFVAALAGNRPNGLFFTGDIGQRIFQQPFSWRAVGVDLRGRSDVLRVNYRTSHQIRRQADLLLGPAVTDTDGNTEDRRHTVSVVNGAQPTISRYATAAEEEGGVGTWLAGRVQDGIQPHEVAVIVRSAVQVPRAIAALGTVGIPHKVLDKRVQVATGRVSVCTMHLAKGLEFRAVAVIACDDEVLPLQERMETVGDEGDLQETYETERHLLYVACTRARDHLLVSCVEPGSEFLDDLRRLE